MRTDQIVRHYDALRAAARADVAVDDVHALAAVLALALTEAGDYGLPADELGLAPADLGALIDAVFPTACRAPFRLDRHDVAPPDEEERLLVDLLDSHRDRHDRVGFWLARLLARRSMRPDHLWQDLGLANRGELNGLLARHFPALHAGNVNNMRWKKYFYRRLCEGEGFTLCTAPSCSACTDFADCFGDETGLSPLARTRLEIDRRA